MGAAFFNSTREGTMTGMVSMSGTNKNWKAQTFYTAPIKDLNCVEEKGNIRYSKNCDDSGGQDGTAFFALHWEIPANWTNPDFEDANWPNATTFTNKTTGLAQTSQDGIFAAGDCREGAIAQVAAATGEGVMASYGVKAYLK